MLDIQIAVFEACEWRAGEIAERLDRSTEALRLRRTGKKRAFIEEIYALVCEGIAKRVALRFQQADAKRRVSEKAWRNLELLLERTEKNEGGADVPIVDALLLGAVKEALDRTEGKSLDRKAVLSQHTEIHQHEQLVNEDRVEVDYEDLDGILTEAKRLNLLNSRALLPPASAIEAELITQPEASHV